MAVPYCSFITPAASTFVDSLLFAAFWSASQGLHTNEAESRLLSDANLRSQKLTSADLGSNMNEVVALLRRSVLDVDVLLRHPPLISAGHPDSMVRKAYVVHNRLLTLSAKTWYLSLRRKFQKGSIYFYM